MKRRFFLGVWVAAPATAVAVGVGLGWKMAGKHRPGAGAFHPPDSGHPAGEVRYARTSERAQTPTKQRTDTPERSAAATARGAALRFTPPTGFLPPDKGAMSRGGGTAAEAVQRGRKMPASGLRRAEPARTAPAVARQ